MSAVCYAKVARRRLQLVLTVPRRLQHGPSSTTPTSGWLAPEFLLPLIISVFSKGSGESVYDFCTLNHSQPNKSIAHILHVYLKNTSCPRKKKRRAGPRRGIRQGRQFKYTPIAVRSPPHEVSRQRCSRHCLLFGRAHARVQSLSPSLRQSR